MIAAASHIITTPQIEAIDRLLLLYFDDRHDAASTWLHNHWNVEQPRQLGSSDRARRVIYVLKYMLRRRGIRV